MSLTSSRRIARRVLAEIRTREGWAHDILGAELSRLSLDPEDAAFVTRLVYGTVATEGTLDDALDARLDRPSRLHPLVRDALRTAAHEILFMRTPTRVAVHQGVENVREVARSAAGLANAVLRRLAADAADFPWGDPATDTAALARLTGHPLWLAELLVSDLGRAHAEEMMRADLEPAPLYLAHNPFKIAFDPLVENLKAEGADPVPCGPVGCIEARRPSSAVRGGSLERGDCLAADAAAQFVAAIAAPPSQGRGVDVAAGRGTKTLLMQATTARSGVPAEILAADIHAFKTDLLAARMKHLEVPGITAVTADVTLVASAVSLLGGAGSADTVLVDAPCSGLGTLRRHPEKRWRLTPADIDSVALLSATLLSTASRLVRPGGFMVYSTCTVTERENARVVRGFLTSEEGQGFKTVRLDRRVPEGWERFVGEEGWFSAHPTSGGPDGHFAALLTRE